MGFELLKSSLGKDNKEKNPMMKKMRQEPERQKMNRNQKKDKVDLGRRKFIRNAVVAGMGIVATVKIPLAIRKGYNVTRDYFNSENKNGESTEEQIRIGEDDEATIKDVIKKKKNRPIKSEDIKFHERESLAEALSFGKEEKVVFDREFMENIERHWLKRFKKSKFKNWL